MKRVETLYKYFNLKTISLSLLCLLSMQMCGNCAVIEATQSIEISNDSNYTKENFWHENGKVEEKIIEIGFKILNANNINRRIVFRVSPSKDLNAYSNCLDKVVTINKGILPYIDSDDELAFIVGHEIAHALEAYKNPLSMLTINSQLNEYKADSVGLELMAKAGYNPIAAITVATKIFPESLFNVPILSSHPKSSKRIMALYKQIYERHRVSLNSTMTESPYFKSFKLVSNQEIKEYNVNWRKKQERLNKKKYYNK